MVSDDPMTQRAPQSALEAVVHSTAAVALARFVMPITLSVIGFFLVTTLADVKGALDKADKKIEDIRSSFWHAQDSFAKGQSDMAVKIGVLGEKLDNLGRRVDRLDQTVNQPPHP